jgi:16S rRNA (adenine1518-N6/adenine1519-N6)-dimethyltransferase
MAIMDENLHHFTAKKSLGQNFLIANGPCKHMADMAHISPHDTVIEIGPGKGILTSVLLARGAHVIAIEKDYTLAALLQEKYKKELSEGTFTLIQGDILTVDPALYTEKPYKVVANIPYNITGELIELLLTAQQQPLSITLLVQKEVAERIVVRDGKESILSQSVKVFGQPHYGGTVKATLFRPMPKVNSAIIHISHIQRDVFKRYNITEKLFFSVLKAGFAHKRKKVSKNIYTFLENQEKTQEIQKKHSESSMPAQTASIDDTFTAIEKYITEKVGVRDARAETLTTEHWLSITALINDRLIAKEEV